MKVGRPSQTNSALLGGIAWIIGFLAFETTAHAVRVVEVYPSTRPGEVFHGNVSVVQAVATPAAAASFVPPTGAALANPNQPMTQRPIGDPVADTAQDGVDEALRAHALETIQYGAINNSNPMSEGFDPAASQALPPEMRGQVEKIQKILGNPMIQKYLKTFSDPNLIGPMQKLVESGALKKLGIVQLCFLVFWLFFKAWVMNGAESFGEKVSRSFILSVAYAGIGFFLIPYTVLGQPYLMIASSVVKNFTSSSPPPLAVDRAQTEMRVPAGAVPPPPPPTSAGLPEASIPNQAAVQAALGGQLPAGIGDEPHAQAPAAQAPSH